MKFSCCSMSRCRLVISARGAVDQLLGLPDVNKRRGPACLANLCQTQRFLPRVQRPGRDRQLQIERTQREVPVGDLADQAGHDGAAPPLARQDLRPRGLVRTPVLPPEIRFPRRRQTELHDAGRSGFTVAVRRGALSLRGRLCINLWKLSRSGDAVLRLGLENAGRRNPEVVVLPERLAHQLPQRLVLEHRLPLGLAKRRRVRRRRLRLSAECFRRDDFGPLVIGADGGAACRRRRERQPAYPRTKTVSCSSVHALSPGTRSCGTCGCRRAASRSKSTNSSGMRKMAMSVAASMPVITTVPRI